MNISVEEQLRHELAPGERLLWSGRPGRGIRFGEGDAFLIPFSLLWGGFAIFWERTLITQGAPLFSALFGMLFVLIGLYLIVGRFPHDAWRRSKTVYGLTDRRALVVDGLVNRRVRSVPLQTVLSIALRGGADRSGTITCITAGAWSDKAEHPPLELEMVEEARRVYDLIRDARANLLTPPKDDAPDRRWDLPAPESAVLLAGPEASEAWALKLALLELVVRQTLRVAAVEEQRRFIGVKRTDVLVPGPRGWPAGRSLRAVGEVYAAAPSRAYADGTVGVPVDTLAQAVFKRYRRWIGNLRWSGCEVRFGYVRAEVLPALEERGLYAQERHRRLGLFSATRWVLTPAGMAAKADRQARMTINRQGLFGGRSVAVELLALARSLGGVNGVDAAVAAIDEGVDRGWHTVHGGE